MLTPTRPASMRLLLPLLPLLLTACGSLSKVPVQPPQIPPPAPELMQRDSLESWQAFSQKVEAFLQRAKQAVTDLQPK